MKPEPKSKKEYDRLRYLGNKNNILKQRAKYREENRLILRQKAKEYYDEHKEESIARSKKSKKSRDWNKTDKGRKFQRDWHRKPENKLKDSIRGKTRNKYGKLPSGMEYHHPKPYSEDIWIGVQKEEHSKWENL